MYDAANSRMIVFSGDNVGNNGPVIEFFDVRVLTNANGLGGTPAWTQLSPPETRRMRWMDAPQCTMFVDFGKLIHNQLPDKNGQTLPSDLMFGAYRVRDIGDSPAASLYEGKVIVDKTFGHVTYGCSVSGTWPPLAQAILGPNPGFTLTTLTGFAHTDSTNIDGFLNPAPIPQTPNPIPPGTVFGH